MKTATFAVTALLFVVGCGGVDVGGIPVDVGGLNFNGDINVGDLNFGGELENELLGASSDSSISSSVSSPDILEEPIISEESIAETEIIANPHPADTNEDFFLDIEELLAYGVAFQNGELDEGQDKSWLDTAVSIWQARADGAYFDDMESDEPLNWRSTVEETMAETDEAVTDDTVADEAAADDTVADVAGKGYDILFKVTPLSPVSFDLTVVDPTEKYNSTRTTPSEIGWGEGTAWDGFYRVQVYVGNNYNGVNEQVRFLISVYKGGELILEEEHALAESSLWDDLFVSYP